MTGSREVIFHIPSLRGGGAERVAVDIARHFLSKGYAPVFFIYSERTDYELPDGVEVVVVHGRGHLARVLALRTLIKRRRPAAVVSFLTYANLVSVLANLGNGGRTRLVVSEHIHFTMPRAAGAKSKIQWMLACWLYQASHSVVAVSKGVADDLRRALKGSAAGRVVVIHNPCFVQSTVRRISGDRRHGASLLAVGRLVEQKGFDVLIRAFARVCSQIEDARLVIAGEGPLRPGLEALIRELGLSGSVSLPGFTRDVSRLYENADLFVCSSRREGFGNVIVEALSFGLPVVSTRCPHGPAEILQGGRYGRLVPVEDEQGLATAIVESLGAKVQPEVQIARARAFLPEIAGDRYLVQAGLVPAPTAHRTPRED
jgi:glycosyltransferase involved in cell wall biosynthesis